MFDQFFFIHASGLLLFQATPPKDKAFIDKIITQVLIEKRQPAQPLISASHKYYYKFIKELNLLALATLPKAIYVESVDNIISGMCISFIQNCETAVRTCEIDYDANHYQCFAELYEKNLGSLIRTGKLFQKEGGDGYEKLVRQTFNEELGARAAAIQEETAAAQQDDQCTAEPEVYAATVINGDVNAVVEANEQPSSENSPQSEQVSPEQKMEQLKQKMKEQRYAYRMKQSTQIRYNYQSKQKSKSPLKVAAPSKTEPEDFQKYSKIDDAGAGEVDHVVMLDEIKSKASEAQKAENSTFNFFKTKPINEKTIDEFSAKFKNQLLEQNVAAETVDGILSNIKTDLAQCYKSTFTLAKNVISKTIAEYIGKILYTSPNFILNQIAESRRQRQLGNRSKPYTIAIVGINGMGKTTTIGKLLYKFKQHSLNSFVCACDSFRSGAVEQVKTHCDRLGAGCYDQGYGKNPSAIAKYGIQQAQSEGSDVVLIDTAGRMHNNAGLMQELCKLISDNQPDLVIYVGEALVGSSGVVQIKEYSHQIQEQSGRGIDGVILTKYDTIGDKVGAALNFCYASGLPIYYVGVGQGYPDLAEVEISEIVSQLI